MSNLQQLLVVQEHDTAIEQLRHRLAHMPERAELDGHEAALAALGRDIDEREAKRRDLARRQQRIEDEVASLLAKRDGANAKLYDGSITSPKDLQALQDEVASLERRAGELEEGILELMVEAEPLDAELATLAGARAQREAAATDATARLAGASADVDSSLAAEVSARAEAASQVGADALAAYEQRRTQLGGVAVARLRGATCEACHLTLSAVEVDQIRRSPPDVIVTCSECGSMLVRD